MHVVYGGAHLFKADSAQKLGAVALRSLRGIRAGRGDARRGARLQSGRGVCGDDLRSASSRNWSAKPSRISGSISRTATATAPDAEEDGHAASSAAEVAAGLAAGTLPPFIGIRVKPFNEDLARAQHAHARHFRHLAARARRAESCRRISSSRIPKVQIAAHVTAAAKVCALLEKRLGLAGWRAAAGTDGRDAAVDHRPRGTLPAARLHRSGGGALLERAFRRVRLHRVLRDHRGVSGDGASGVRLRAHGDGRGARGHRRPAFPMARRTSCRSARIAARTLSARATARKPRGRASARGGVRSTTTCTPCATASTKAGICIRRSSSSRYAAVYSFFLDGLAAASSRLKTFVGKGRAGLAVRRCLRRRRDRPGAAEFFPARHRLRRDHRGRSARDRPDARRNPLALVPENSCRAGESQSA